MLMTYLFYCPIIDVSSMLSADFKILMVLSVIYNFSYHYYGVNDPFYSTNRFTITSPFYSIVTLVTSY